jgi:hypothetical protein
VVGCTIAIRMFEKVVPTMIGVCSFSTRRLACSMPISGLS